MDYITPIDLVDGSYLARKIGNAKKYMKRGGMDFWESEGGQRRKTCIWFTSLASHSWQYPSRSEQPKKKG
jgi:hypothetical protein